MSDKLTKKLQVLLTEEEVGAVNRVILNEALETEQRPISVSAFIRNLIQKELSNKSVEQKSIIKQNLKNLKDK
jgi:plasmid stability protein|tara:strand:+ start:2030 stop:2248 length:219 start_codon:yes stop_codon:yes gene_type:complete